MADGNPISMNTQAFVTPHQVPADKAGELAGQVASKEASQPQALQDIINQAVQVLQNPDTIRALAERNKVAIRELVPEIDDAELEDLSTDMAELEQLMALLTLESDEEQAKVIATRIDAKVKEMETHHEKVLQKVQSAIDEAVRQQEIQEKNKILGWIMTALAVFAAVVAIAATAITGGGSLAIVGCCIAGVSALFSLTNQVLDATGVIEKSINSRAEKLAEKKGISFDAAKKQLMKEYQVGMLVAQCVLALASICFSVASLATAGKAAADIGETAAKVLKGVRGLQVCLQIASLATSGVSTANAWKLLFVTKEEAKLQAELQELKAILEKIQAAIDEEQEALKIVCDQMSDALASVLKVFEADFEGINAIMDNTQMMS